MIFFSIVGVIDISVGVIGNYLQHHAKGGEYKMFDDLVLKDKHDIIILGSSRAHCHYDTPLLSELLNIDVYNAGYDGNGVVLSFGIMKMVLERYDPKMVVFDVEPAFDIMQYPPDNNHKRYLGRLKPYYYKDGIGEIFKDISKEEWYKVHSGMMRYNTVIVPLTIDNILNRGIEKNGFGPTIGEMEKDREINQIQEVLIDQFKLHYVKKLINIVQKHNVPLIVVASPKYGMNNSSELNPIKDICFKAEVPFLDYYADTSFVKHKELFKEPMHLNDSGARAFSRCLADDIKLYYKN